MTVRRKKKITKLRGSRTCSGGHVKKRRGAGSRGGRGRAGMMKHKKSLWVKQNPRRAGDSLHKRVGRKFGFKRPYKIIRTQKINSIKIRDIDLIANKMGLKEIDLSNFGYQKVLCGGKLTKPISIKAKMFSKRAKEQIEQSGGKIIEG